MRGISPLTRIVLFLGFWWLLMSGVCRANVDYHVSLNTSSLIGHPAGPFSIAFQLTDGGDPADANNTVVLRNFRFVGGGASGSPMLSGSASGDLLSTITLADSTFLNTFTQEFTPGAELRFDVSLTTNLDGGETPDHFSFSILDRTGTAIPTLGGENFYVFAAVDVASPNPALQVFNSDPTVAPPGGGGSLNVQPTFTVNSPPVVKSKNIIAAAGSDCAANVSPADVDAGSFDPDGDQLTLALDPPGPYGLGEHAVTLMATDGFGASTSVGAIVTVVDRTPPDITGVAVNPASIWPPNHKMVSVTVNYAVSDNCTPAPGLVNRLNVSGNQGTAADWQIVDAHHLLLRADKGNVYTITITSMDGNGNRASKSLVIVVPHDQRN